MGSKKRIQAAKKAAGGEISLRKACALLGVNRSSVYKAQKPSARAIKDQNLAEKIQAVQDSKRYTYGVDRMTAELRRQGVPVNHKRVSRVMKAYKLNAIIRKKRNWFCDVDNVVHTRLPGNLLNREFHADAPGQKLVSDVTYLPTADGHWCYASLVKDLCTSEIVACVVSKKQTLALGIETLNQLNGRIKPNRERCFTPIKDAFIRIPRSATHWNGWELRKAYLERVTASIMQLSRVLMER